MPDLRTCFSFWIVQVSISIIELSSLLVVLSHIPFRLHEWRKEHSCSERHEYHFHQKRWSWRQSLLNYVFMYVRKSTEGREGERGERKGEGEGEKEREGRRERSVSLQV